MSLVDLKLSSTGDIDFSKGGKLTEQGTESLAQKISIALQLRTGEWKFDESIGVPYSSVLLQGKGNKAFIDTLMQSYILNIEGVGNLSSYSSTINSNRTMSISFSATSDGGGEEVELLVEV